MSIQFLVRKYYGYGHVINCPVDGVKSPYGCSPLLYYNHWPVSKFRDHNTKLLLRKNIVPKFKETERKEIYTRFIQIKWEEVYNLPRILISEGGPEILLYL
jgi:hypothetical protein